MPFSVRTNFRQTQWGQSFGVLQFKSQKESKVERAGAVSKDVEEIQS